MTRLNKRVISKKILLSEKSLFMILTSIEISHVGHGNFKVNTCISTWKFHARSVEFITNTNSFHICKTITYAYYINMCVFAY